LRDRTISELQHLPTFGEAGQVFPFGEFKRSWATAKRIAGIENLHFHDVRRTAITRLNLNGVPMAVAGKIAGHARLETTMKHYVATDAEIIRGVTDRMNQVHSIRQSEIKGQPEFVN
jgi:integrase